MAVPDMIRRPIVARPWKSTGIAGFGLAMLTVVVACATSESGSDDSAQARDSTEAVADKYVASADEGLGASVAILIDNSGSMKKEAAGDDRPKYIVAREAIEAMLASTDSFVAKQPDFP